MAEGTFAWARTMGGEGSARGFGIALDNDGNVYTTGGFDGTVDFDPGEGVFELTSAGSSDIFVQKLDKDGNFVWARAMGGENFDESSSIAVDSEGNVYTTGGFEGTVDFDPGEGVFELTSAGSSDIFVQKLDKDGNFVWARAMGGEDFNQGFDIAVDRGGNVYTTGFFREKVDFDPGVGEFDLGSAGNSDIFVHKLDSDGEFVWARAMGGENVDESFGIAVDDDGNVYTTGFFEATVDFDPGMGVFELTAAGTSDIFVQKLDRDGNFVWARAMGGGGFGQGFSIAVDSVGNVYTTGIFEGPADFDPGVGNFELTSEGFFDIFVHKLDSDGNFVWARAMGGSGNDWGLDIAVDGMGNVYSTGYFQSTVDFDPGVGNFELTSAGSSDIYVHKLDTDGNFVWARAMGGSSFDQGSGITVDSVGNVYTTGYFQSTVDFDPGVGVFELAAAGTRDIFVLKLSQIEGEVTPLHSSDQNGDGIISLSELLRVIQFFNTGGLHCVTPPATSEDGYLPGPNAAAQNCTPHASDYNPQDWVISLSELLRLIQFFNTGGYFACPDAGSEDGYCPGTLS